MTEHVIKNATPTPGGGATATLDDGTVLTLSDHAYKAWQNAARVHPNIIVRGSGSCGSDYVFVSSTGNHQAEFSTGFTVNGDAVDYTWQLELIDNYGNSTYDRGGPLDFRSQWDSGPEVYTGGGNGPLDITVVTPSSFAILDSGTVCFGYPVSAPTYIF
ncbi:hypothetical protein [Antrihabitans cavernicola]|uniref:Uncharacterized protein n=1 Tax=Antrihabitans cavernicola TaxID=2495913 RepID=A0A5A7S3K0_9NOCA|nr:hypothetical protein [Spelaeibacter cavernicola]KAA0015970.1 hypothetical protein FOY51_26820 [Spelaeibacter cavernicola]